MKVALALAALCGTAAFSLAFSQARGAGGGGGGAARSGAARPVVVELFTSEGCSSCPSADRVLRELAATQPVAGAEVLALELHVDYWNDLGWKDPFSDAAYSARQASYGASRVYTPQMIVAGGEEFVGSDAKRARQAIAHAAAAGTAAVPVALHVDASADDASKNALRVEVDVGAHAAAAELWLAVTEDGLATDVPRGENAGVHMVHAPVVRMLRLVDSLPAARTASVQRATVALAPSWQRTKLRVVAFVQERDARGPGVISGAAAARVP